MTHHTQKRRLLHIKRQKSRRRGRVCSHLGRLSCCSSRVWESCTWFFYQTNSRLYKAGLKRNQACVSDSSHNILQTHIHTCAFIFNAFKEILYYVLCVLNLFYIHFWCLVYILINHAWKNGDSILIANMSKSTDSRKVISVKHVLYLQVNNMLNDTWRVMKDQRICHGLLHLLGFTRFFPLACDTSMISFCLLRLKACTHSVVLKRIITIAWLEAPTMCPVFCLMKTFVDSCRTLCTRWKQYQNVMVLETGHNWLVFNLITSNKNTCFGIGFVEEAAVDGQQGATHDTAIGWGDSCHLYTRDITNISL